MMAAGTKGEGDGKEEKRGLFMLRGGGEMPLMRYVEEGGEVENEVCPWVDESQVEEEILDGMDTSMEGGYEVEGVEMPDGTGDQVVVQEEQAVDDKVVQVKEEKAVDVTVGVRPTVVAHLGGGEGSERLSRVLWGSVGRHSPTPPRPNTT